MEKLSCWHILSLQSLKAFTPDHSLTMRKLICRILYVLHILGKVTAYKSCGELLLLIQIQKWVADQLFTVIKLITISIEFQVLSMAKQSILFYNQPK